MKNTENPVLQTEKLCKSYGHARVLDEVSLSVERGSIYGLIGENGAGKTTLFRILAGISRPESGEIRLSGHETPDGLRRARRNAGFMIEQPAFYPNMTVLENITVQQIEYYGQKDRNSAIKLLSRTGLSGQERKRARHLSTGMKQRLALALALLREPEILILDEPVNGLDPLGIAEFRRLIGKLNREENMTIVLSSHILSELSQMATHYGFLHRGRLLQEVPAASVPGTAEGLEGYYMEMLGEKG